MVNKRREFPWWLLATAVIAVFMVWKILSDHLYGEVYRIVAQGISITLFVTFVSYGLAVLAGLSLAVAGRSRFRVLRESARFYIEIVRGVPVLILLFYVAFVMSPLLVDAVNWVCGPLQQRGMMDEIEVRDFSMLWRAIFALSVSYSAFLAEIFRAGIESVGRGQVEAAEALGLNRLQTFRFIVLPQALRTILPPLANDFVVLIKDSALVSVLGVEDITQMAKVYAAGSFRFFETYNVVAFVYLVMTVSLSLGLRAFESRMKAHERR